MKLATVLTGLANTIPVSAIINFAATVKAYALNEFAAPTAAVNLNNQKLTNVATPTTSTDGANKGYVDGVVTGVAKVARGTFTGDGVKTAFDLVHNLNNASVQIDVTDSSGGMVLVDTPPKASATTTTAVATFSVAPAAGEGAFSWVAVG